MRDEDAIQHILAANTMDWLLVFTNRGKVYQLKVHELPDSGRTAKGVPIINVVNMQPDETVTTLMKVRDYANGQYLFFTTRLGRVKRTALINFARALDRADRHRSRAGRRARLGAMTSGEDDVMLVSQDGQAASFREEVVRAMGRPAAGVIGIRLDKGDRVIASETVVPGKDLLVVAEKGLGKRTRTDHFMTKGRGGKGVTAMKLTTRTGKIVGAGMVDDDHASMLMSTSGKVIRLPVSQIPTIGRQTQGVTLMKLDPDETVATMTIAENKDGRDRPRIAAAQWPRRCRARDHVATELAVVGPDRRPPVGGAPDSSSTVWKNRRLINAPNGVSTINNAVSASSHAAQSGTTAPRRPRSPACARSAHSTAYCAASATPPATWRQLAGESRPKKITTAARPTPRPASRGRSISSSAPARRSSPARSAQRAGRQRAVRGLASD